MRRRQRRGLARALRQLHAQIAAGRLKQRDKIADWIKEYSPITHVTKDAPPIGLYYGGVKGAKVGESHPDPTHSPILGLKLAEKLKAVGVEVVFHSNTEPNEKFPTAQAFLIDRLKK